MSTLLFSYYLLCLQKVKAFFLFRKTLIYIQKNAGILSIQLNEFSQTENQHSLQSAVSLFKKHFVRVCLVKYALIVVNSNHVIEQILDIYFLFMERPKQVFLIISSSPPSDNSGPEPFTLWPCHLLCVASNAVA